VKTASSDAEKIEALIRRHLDGTFRRVVQNGAGCAYETVEKPLDFIPDYAHLIRVARGNFD
jgi:hypothetical protein